MVHLSLWLESKQGVVDMLKPIRKLVRYTSSSKGAKVTLIAWIAIVLLLSIFAPSAKEYEGNSTEGSINQDTPSEIADQVITDEFPTDDGLTALLVFHRDGKITEDDRHAIEDFSKWLASDEQPEYVASALPFHEFPTDVQNQMFSEDESRSEEHTSELQSRGHLVCRL